LAFEFGWARSIVEQFELVAVPQAHPWLIGACNIEGELMPVIDMVRLISPSDGAFVRQTDQRLLVLGDGVDAVAVIFSRMPQMLRFSPQDGDKLNWAPASIREVVRGMANNARGEVFIEIDGDKFVPFLASASA
jgi:chemotaxis signal transduction protein